MHCGDDIRNVYLMLFIYLYLFVCSVCIYYEYGTRSYVDMEVLVRMLTLNYSYKYTHFLSIPISQSNFDVRSVPCCTYFVRFL